MKPGESTEMSREFMAMYTRLMNEKVQSSGNLGHVPRLYSDRHNLLEGPRSDLIIDNVVFKRL
jgi:hypothetical protein